jgi:hypothetical protein
VAGLTAETQTRVSGLSSARGRHQREARESAKRLGAAGAAEMQRSSRTTQRCGSRLRRGLPGATAQEDDNKRRRCEAYLLAQVLDGFAMTRQRRRRGIDNGGAKLGLGFQRRAARAKAAAMARVGRPMGCGAT